MDEHKPVIGISTDVEQLANGVQRFQVGEAYVRAVIRAGGAPVLLPPIEEMVEHHLNACMGIVIIGGADARMERFGKRTHPKATPMNADRQAYDTALLSAIAKDTDYPLLAVCLGMQLMALEAGGDLDQYLPETLPDAGRHREDRRHTITPMLGGTVLGDPSAEGVASSHKQAVTNPGSLRIIGRSDDGLIEAIDRPGANFQVGVQWHPERTGDGALGQGLFDQHVRACRMRIPY